MKLSAVLWLSLLGMGVSSATVAWLTPQASASRPSPGAAAPSLTPSSSPQTAVTAPGLPPDPPPTASPSFTVDGPLRLEARLGHASLPGAEGGETFVMVEVAAPTDTTGQARAPVNLSIVIDRSGSMKGQRLTNAIAAARGMLARLRPDDTVSLVAYDDRAELLIAPTPVDRLDAFVFERTLSSLRGRGHTCMSCGLDMALTQVRRRSGAVNRVLLLSDGVANRGLTSVEDFRIIGDQARREQTAVASIGVDLDYDERPLFAVSQASNGNHYFVENPAGLPAVFEREAESLVSTIADRVDVDVMLAPGVELLDVVARGHRREGDRVALSFGTLNAGEDRSAVLRVRLPAGHGAAPVADVRLAYRDLIESRDRRADGELSLVLDPERDELAALDVRVEERLGRKNTLDALLLANEAFASGDLAGAQRQLEAAKAEIEQRRTRTAATPTAAPGTAIDDGFQQQLDALGRAQSSFDEAAEEAPAPKAAAKSSKGKKALKLNAAVANPFG
ncbi:vWA domain-containing protein [Paraliomyxa miuraensis]|uniref:vWA domain-containing protein n=1 Tax=Paraliomyxa miuraensis TaxID=376150 RepID=UPI00225123B1|nr:VWA domain-containing protein [Paraliomyxa miuraensis]MCX4242708.1 VWA domain-containing protein [Paraliomyxa miuraensis]